MQVQGISGTDDTRHTLPLSLQKQYAAGTSTRVTDARNLESLFTPGKVQVQRLHSGTGAASGGSTHIGLQLLDRMAIEQGVQAVIDAGAVHRAGNGQMHCLLHVGCRLCHAVITCHTPAAGVRYLAAPSADTLSTLQQACAACTGFASLHTTCAGARSIEHVMCALTALWRAGALLAGLELDRAAAHVAAALQGAPGHTKRGVVFHGPYEWTVMDLTGFCRPHTVSPIKEHEALVLFDQARCRCGASCGTHHRQLAVSWCSSGGSLAALCDCDARSRSWHMSSMRAWRSCVQV